MLCESLDEARVKEIEAKWLQNPRIELTRMSEASCPPLTDLPPGSWVILERSSSKEPHKIGEADFDCIYVLGYEKHDQDYYTAFRSPDLEGYLPLRVEGKGANKSFTVRVKDDTETLKRCASPDIGTSTA